MVDARPWGEAHRREALRRTYEIAAEHSADHRVARQFGSDAWSGVQDERSFRLYMMLGGLDAARIDREARRVRALAEGRLVRETVWRLAADPDGFDDEIPGTYDSEAEARVVAAQTGQRLVPVTRIRRAR